MTGRPFNRLAAHGYAPMPLLHRSKAAFIKGWPEFATAPPTQAQLDAWDKRQERSPDRPIGIVCGTVIGVDIDVLHPDLAEQTEVLAHRVLGPCRLKRIGRHPKRLLVNRLAQPIRKMQSAGFELDGLKCVVEVLGRGQQFVAYGIHEKTGQPYSWPDLDIAGVPARDLSLTTEDNLRQFLAEFESVAELLGAERVSRGASGGGEHESGPASDQMGYLADAITHLPNDDVHYDQWVRIGIALKRALPDDPGDAFALFDTWSQCSSKYRPELTAHTWEGLNTEDRKNTVGAGSIYYAAREAGWTPPRSLAEEDFEPVSEAEAEIQIDGPQGLLTEDGMALSFAQAFAGRLAYCHGPGRWLEWTGNVWHPDTRQVAFQWAREHIREIAAEAPARLRFITSKVAFAGGVERFARTDPLLATTTEEWDQDHLLLGTPGGTVDLRTGILRPGRPEDRITKTAGTAPSAGAECPRWRSFLLDVTEGNLPFIRFLQQWAGYCLTGLVREQVLVFIYGPGGNGKSVFLNVLTGIMGDYAAVAPMDALTASKYERHTTDLAMLRGARIVTSSETDKGRAWAETRIKQLTGGEKITARFMHRDNFTYLPTFKITVVGNHRPALRHVDEAARRRFIIVPFTTVPPKPDKQLEERLQAEWPGIMRWAIEGALDWQENGLIRPDVIKAATDDYFKDQDTFGEWLETHCVVQPGNDRRRATSAELFYSWEQFARSKNEPPGGNKDFADALKSRGLGTSNVIPDGHGKRVRGFTGIELAPVWDVADSPDFLQ